MLDQFVISTTQQALAMDSLLSSHPIHTTVTNPAEIEAIFDMISYKKVILRWLVVTTTPLTDTTDNLGFLFGSHDRKLSGQRESSARSREVPEPIHV